MDEHRRFLSIDAAFKAGDLDALRAAVEDPASIPNGSMPMSIGSCLEYAIYHSPVAFIGVLLDLGADPRPADHAGFPPLIAALSCAREVQGAKARPDVLAILDLLLAHGADPEQRGLNDWTALHMAVAQGQEDAVRLLLKAGADPHARTRIDERESAREMAVAAGLTAIARLLAEAERRSPA